MHLDPHLGRVPPYNSNEGERLAAMQSLDVFGPACREVLQALAKVASQMTCSPFGGVTLVGEKTTFIAASYGLFVPDTPREMSFCNHTILNGDEPFVVEDMAQDRRFDHIPAIQGTRHIAYAGVALKPGYGPAVGALCVLDFGERHFSRAHRELLTGLGIAASAVMHRTRRQIGDASPAHIAA